MLLLPSDFLVQHLFNPMGKRITERELCGECSSATPWPDEHRPLEDTFELWKVHVIQIWIADESGS